MIAFHSTSEQNLESILREGLHDRSKHDWKIAEWQSMGGVYFSTTPRHASRRSAGKGMMVVCEIDPDAILADEDEMMSLLHRSLLSACEDLGVTVVQDEDVDGGTIHYPDPQALKGRISRDREAVVMSFSRSLQNLLQRASARPVDPAATRELAEARLAFLEIFTYMGGPYPGIGDVHPSDPALVRYRAAEDLACHMHPDIGINRKNSSFRIKSDIGFEGSSFIRCILLARDSEWIPVYGEPPLQLAEEFGMRIADRGVESSTTPRP